MRIFALILGLIIYTLGFSQKKERPELDLGIKTSINISTLSGTEFENPRPKFGYTAGAYLETPLDKKWSLHSEILGSFRGSNFKNGDTAYTKIALFYIEAAILPSYLLDKNNISIGPYLSYLGLSSLYIGNDQKSKLNDLNFKDLDFGLASYYTINGPIVGFQFGVKVGLSNANNGVNFDGYFPKTGKGGEIRNLSFEIGLLF
ncbi:MAG: hypothetical protein COA58_08205 [Bacteroidetes bacterium]|nr:MAG: hypothetical protein COA58_08205 [Bacteroidota bacterium]